MKPQQLNKPAQFLIIGLAALGLLVGCVSTKQTDSAVAPSGDIAKAVQITATKDCGCGHCAAKGCGPCHGKNCYYCVAKGLVTKECGCGMCSAKGCDMCGPGCDVCKFHLAPNVAEKQ